MAKNPTNCDAGNFFVRNPATTLGKPAPSVMDSRLRAFSYSSFSESGQGHPHHRDLRDEGDDSSLQEVEDVFQEVIGSYTEGPMRETYQINHKRRLHSSFERLYEDLIDEFCMNSQENPIDMTRSQPSLNKIANHHSDRRKQPLSAHQDISLLSLSSSDSENRMIFSPHLSMDPNKSKLNSLKHSYELAGASQRAVSERQERVLTDSTGKFLKIQQSTSSSKCFRSRHRSEAENDLNGRVLSNQLVHEPSPAISNNQLSNQDQPHQHIVESQVFRRIPNIRNSHSSARRVIKDLSLQQSTTENIPHFSVPLHQCGGSSCKAFTLDSFQTSPLKSNSHQQNNSTNYVESRKPPIPYKESVKDSKSFENVNSTPSVNSNNISSQQMKRSMTFTLGGDIQRRSFISNKNHNPVPTQEDEAFHLAQFQRTIPNFFTSFHATSALNASTPALLNLNRHNSSRTTTSRMQPPELPPRNKQRVPLKSHEPIISQYQQNRKFTPSSSSLPSNNITLSNDSQIRTNLSQKVLTQWSEKSISDAIEDLDKMYESLNLGEENLMENAERRDFTSSIQKFAEEKRFSQPYEHRSKLNGKTPSSTENMTKLPHEKIVKGGNAQNTSNDQRKLAQTQNKNPRTPLGYPPPSAKSHNPLRKSATHATAGNPYSIEYSGEKSKSLRIKPTQDQNINENSPIRRSQPSFSRVVVIRGRKN